MNNRDFWIDALLRNIGSNAMGYAFKLALQSISPDIDKLLTELQDQINKINAMNINSCEAAQALVNGVVAEYDQSIMSGCANISQYLGTVTDRVDARFTCATNAPSVVKNPADSGDPNVRNATFVKGNVIWMALHQVAGAISREEKELIMSVIGAVVLYPPADDGSGAAPRYLEPTIVGLRDLLLGRGASAKSEDQDRARHDREGPVPALVARDALHHVRGGLPDAEEGDRVRKAEVRDRKGRVQTLQQPRVDLELCIGCGICEAKCPVLGRPAIYVSSVGESRSKDNQLLLS